MSIASFSSIAGTGQKNQGHTIIVVFLGRKPTQCSGCSSVFPDNNLTIEGISSRNLPPKYKSYFFTEQRQETFQLHTNTYMLFTGREVSIGKNCAQGLDYDPRP